jgi:hypothetical protein
VRDGRFHDGINYFDTIASVYGHKRALALNSLVPRYSLIGPSRLGSHSCLTLTSTMAHWGLHLRTAVQMVSEVVWLDFLQIHLAHMSLSFAKGCRHGRGPLDKNLSDQVVTTSVATPVISPEHHPKAKLSLALTHDNSEAQFLSCEYRVRTLFQGNSCLNCAVKKRWKVTSRWSFRVKIKYNGYITSPLPNESRNFLFLTLSVS